MAATAYDARCVGVREVIRHLRVRQGLSARSLSLKAGVSPSYVGKLEAGEIEPSVRIFARLALVLDMTESEIYITVVLEGLREPLSPTS